LGYYTPCSAGNALLVSGIEILISHPRFYWGENGNQLKDYPSRSQITQLACEEGWS
jgi:hypothetical protein